jgi:hypothetical protein
MLKRLKKFFVKEEPKEETIAFAEIEAWFQKKVTELSFNAYFQKYFENVQEVKTQLHEKLALLKVQEPSDKDRKEVEARVINIVIGHRNNYVKNVERFIEVVTVLKKERFSTIQDYQEVLLCSKQLDKDITDLAARTVKSYQATQHLFFQTLQPVFKLMGELNLLVKNFKKDVDTSRIEKLEKIQELIQRVRRSKEKKVYLQKEITEKEKKMQQKKSELEERKRELHKLKKSKEYTEWKSLLDKKNNVAAQSKVVNDEIYFFFSKLNKVLRKYERISLDNKLIQKYVSDSVAAFWEDEELQIVQVLLKLRETLDDLDFDEKQKKKFLKIIEQQNLHDLQKKGKQLQETSKHIQQQIKKTTIAALVESKHREIQVIDVKKIEEEIGKSKAALTHISIEQTKQEVKQLIQEVFGIIISFS